MKKLTHRNRTCSAFLSGMCLALLAVPFTSLGEVKITASRDYVDKKVAAAVTNMTAYVDSTLSSATNELQKSIGDLPTAQYVALQVEGMQAAVSSNVVSSLEGYAKLSDVTNIVMNIIIAHYGNVAWRTEDEGQTVDAFYHEFPYTEGVETNSTRTVQGMDSYLKLEDGKISVYSTRADAGPHSVTEE